MGDTVKLIIEIPREDYEFTKGAKTARYFPSEYYVNLILNGTPLPKGHGRILDEKDILDTENNDGGWYDLVDMPEYIAGVKAVIEADKESEE